MDVVKKDMVNKGRGDQVGHGERGLVDSAGGWGEVELIILNAAG